jgi:DNA-binding GntR family transcriptional regulator
MKPHNQEAIQARDHGAPRQGRDTTAGQGAAPVARLSRETLQDRVYEALRRAIRMGRFSSGDVLTIRSLATMLGTSAMPVRDAVRRLAQRNTLELLPNGSMRVPLLSAGHFDELTDVRATLEGRAAALAVERMGPEEHRLIIAAAMRNRVAAESADFSAVLAANEELHFSVYHAAHSPLLLSLIEQLWEQSGPYLSIVIRAQTPLSLPAFALGHHDELLDALAARDAEAARLAVSRDITHAAQWYRNSILFPSPSQSSQEDGAGGREAVSRAGL